jgi:hydrogenase-4 component F
MFAYSSIEQMGIIAIALGFGGVLGFYGALLQILAHAIGKAVLFLCSGDIVLRYRTRLVDEVSGVLSITPLTGAVLLLAALAVAGSPPFGLFLSEFTIVRAGLARSSVALVAALLVMLAVVFVALVGAAAAMALGGPPDRPTAGPAYSERSSRWFAAAPLIAGLGALVLLGVWIPGRLDTLIMHSIHAIS